MEDRDIISKFQTLFRDTPSEEWVSRTRNTLRMRMEDSRQADGTWRLSKFFHGVFSHRIAFSGALGAAGIIISVLTVSASRQALPSSTLYPVKLAYESAQGVLAFSQEQQADHSLTVAQERIQELTELSHRVPGDKTARPSELISQTVNRYSIALSNSARTVKQLKAEGKSDIAKRTAQKLETAARAYTTLLSAMDTATDTVSLLADAQDVSREAEHAAKEVLEIADVSGEIPSATPEIVPDLSPSPVSDLVPTSTVLGVSTSPDALPVSPSPTVPSRLIPNVMEEESGEETP